MASRSGASGTLFACALRADFIQRRRRLERQPSAISAGLAGRLNLSYQHDVGFGSFTLYCGNVRGHVRQRDQPRSSPAGLTTRRAAGALLEINAAANSSKSRWTI